MDFYSAYAHGFARVAACTLPVTVADPAANAAQVIAMAQEAHEDGVAVAVFPELCLTGYAIDDLLLQDTLLDATHAAIAEVVAASADLRPVLVVGAPLVHGTRVLNCAVVVHRGVILGRGARSPTCRPTASSTSAGTSRPGDDRRGTTIRVGDRRVPFGPDLIFSATDVPDLKLHVEICEDMWVPIPPSAEASLAGATVLANLSGSPITVARAEDRTAAGPQRERALQRGVRLRRRGPGRVDHRPAAGTARRWSTSAATCSPRATGSPTAPRMTVADVDLDRIRQERLRQGTFDDNRRTYDDRIEEFRTVEFELQPPTGDIGLRRKVDRFPFVPDDPERLALDCYEAYNIQVSGLEQRLSYIGEPKVVIGVSGGLDSTHALIVSARAMDRLGRPRSDIHAFSMPGFATGDTTRSYATRLAKSLGVTFEEIDITASARQMLADIDHPFADGEQVYDVTFENVQAGLRYDYLFRLANHRGGIVVGTGDLSELALGWCTYGVGDQMSHYNVNAGVPKTLVQHLIRWVVGNGEFDEDTNGLLREIVEQEITPELIPTREDELPQSTETSVGPYNLQDFTLFHVHPPRRPAQPDRVPRLARLARRGRGGLAAGATPRPGASPTTSATSAAGSTCSSGASSPASSSARRCPTGPRSRPAARCRRAATGGCRRTRARRVAGRAGERAGAAEPAAG